MYQRDGKIYAKRQLTLKCETVGQDMYQRLDTAESTPGKMWYGTERAADHHWSSR